MMASPPELTLSFINRRPAAAARVLASLPAAEAGNFLETIPTRYAVIALNPMNPWPGSQILAELDKVTGAALVRELEFVVAVRMLRLLAADRRRALLAELPRRLRRSLEISLSYSIGSVGASMTTNIPTLVGTDTVADALSQIKRSSQSVGDIVFITNSAHQLLGVVRSLELIRHPAHAVMQELLATDCPTLLAQTRITNIANLEAWSTFASLPVVSRHGELIGALPHRALRRGEQTGAAPGRLTLVESLVDVLAVCFAGIAALVAGAAGDQNDP